ncbi:MAG TPA: YCF48-related protein, partial [Pyrinomonadaceae bacterium]|nr:YCF48-related protein [Pyrinomonadaceae bacterium]
MLLLLVAFPAFVQAGTWARQRTGTMSWLHSVFFLDQNRGWAVGSKGTLLRTLDGGNTWQQRTASTEDVVRDIFFTDEQNGWMVCEVNAYQLKTNEDARAYLMKTTDGGEHWKRIEIKGFDVDAILVRAVFSRNGRGWTFGEAGSIYTTHDAGDTWTKLRSPTRRLLLGGMFVDDDRGWLVGAGATIIQTSDGGDTWYQSTLPQVEKSVRFTATSFVDNRKGWAVGSAGRVYRT